MSNIAAEQKKIYSVSELTRQIRALLEDAFPKVWVEGEVSNFGMHHSSGHSYFSIKDADSILACVLFKGFSYKLKFKIQDGMSVICFGRIGVYDKKGQYQLYVEEVEPKGIGSLQLAFTQLKEKLSKEGLFSDSHKIPIPSMPEKIGIVTSPTGAAIRDMLHIIERRFPNMHIIVYPVKVQGAGSAEEIAEAISAFNRMKNVDVLIVGRGGGSLEDLWAFNEEIVARAIYNSEIPVISAVGHEIDYTIADFVADMRAPTPSAAAELAVPEKAKVVENIGALKQRLKMALLEDLGLLKGRLDGIMRRYAFRQPGLLIEQYQQRIDEQIKALLQSLSHFVEIKKEQLKTLEAALNALSPTAILSRGYSITTAYPSGQIIKDASAAKRGEQIKTRLAKGELLSRVE